jgi:flagellar protein FlaF
MSYGNNHPYAPVVPQPGNPRESEIWALTEAGRRMAMAARENEFAAMRDALRLNWRMWTFFQTELIIKAEKNELEEVGLNLLALSQFVDKHTAQVLAGPTPENMQVLIDINRNIAAGLSEALQREKAQAANQAPAEPTSVSVTG